MYKYLRCTCFGVICVSLLKYVHPENNIYKSLYALLHHALFHWHFLLFLALLIFPQFFYFSLCFSSCFGYQHVKIKNTRKNVRKHEKKRENIIQSKKMFLYLGSSRTGLAARDKRVGAEISGASATFGADYGADITF